MRIFALFIGGLIWSLANQAASFSGEEFPKTTVARVQAYHANGTVTLGSAVLLGGERLVTNCHVTHAAKSIQIVHDGQNFGAEVASQDSNHDLCTLRARGIMGTPAVATTRITVGQTVFAAGFPGGNRFAVTAGRIIALHDYDGANVIQVSSPFDSGASGGGLFDEDGRLIGVITFKARSGGVFHFALPIAWAMALDRPEPERSAAPTLAFWRQPYEKQPYFLRAVSLEANQKWGALAALGEQWAKENPLNPSAWIVLGTAFQHLQRPDEANSAFGEAGRLARNQEPQQPRHANTLTYVNTRVTSIGHPVAMALPGFNPAGIEMPVHATE